MNRYLGRIRSGLLTLGLPGLIALTALAVTRPFHLVEHGTVTVVNGMLVADGTGTATQLGHFSLHRTARLTPNPGAPTIDVDGEATLRAENGDQLKASFDGTLNPNTGRAILIYEWEGGTGRFQNARGTTVWRVQLNDDQTYDVVADGVIDF